MRRRPRTSPAHAGAHALLVSHWPVNSGAAVKLTTRTFTALERQPGIGRAEALRQRLSDLADHNMRPFSKYSRRQPIAGATR
jgi:CHAT domain-containing protein